MSFASLILFDQTAELKPVLLFVGGMQVLLFICLCYLALRKSRLKKELEYVTGQFSLIKDELEEAIELSRYRESLANQANQAKNSFLAIMSHELRTPLNAILGLTDVMAGSSLNKEQQECISTIKDGGELLLELVHGLLDFSKIESGSVALEKEAFDLKRLPEDVCRLFRSQALDKNLEFNVSFKTDSDIRLWGDLKRSKQILINLVSNAIKFSEDGTIDIAFEVIDRGDGLVNLCFSVRDYGMGIAKEDISRIFEPFEQGDSTNKRLNGGTGLGLAICDRLCHLMNGSIYVDTEIQKGSTFTVSILCDSVDLSCSVEDKKVSDSVETYEPVAEESFEKCRILLVEDNRVNVKVMSMLFKQIGVQFDTAVNGLEAVSAVKQKEYDLIFMDIQMPVMDGLEATKAIRTENLISQPRIVALTAAVSHEDELACYQSGMDDYLTKPIRLEKIATAIAKIKTKSEV